MENVMLEREINGIGYLAGNWPLDSQKSTVLFIHGAGGSSAFWQEQVKALSARLNTLAIDLPGHGRTSGEGKQKIADYAKDVAHFLTAIDISNPVLCGLSMGGAIVQRMLLDCPARIKAGILIGTGARMKVAPSFFETIQKDYSGFADWLSKICVSKKTDPQKVNPFREDLLRCRVEVTIGDFEACNRFDVVDEISAIRTPVMVITSEEDKLTPPKLGEFLEKSIRKARRIHIMDAGHLAPMEKSEATNQVILNFLDEVGL
jgi:pimeloyl-ACP methyl ester carboxylesterase